MGRDIRFADGLDALDFEEAVTRATGVAFERLGALPPTLGALETAITQAAPRSEFAGAKCMSAMSFYRVRRCLADLGARGRIDPSTLLSETGTSPRALRRRLRRIEGWEISALSRPGGYSIAALSVLAAALWAISAPAAPVAGGGLASFFAAALALAFLAGLGFGVRAELRFEHGLTVGELAERLSAENAERLVAAGATVRAADVRRIVRTTAAELCGGDLRDYDESSRLCP